MPGPRLFLLLLTAASLAAAEPDFVPQWAKSAVWYQIFPERFRNGDPANDPQLADLAGAFPDLPELPWQISPWTADWYERQPWEKWEGKQQLFVREGETRPANMLDVVQRRRYGGDLQGILDRLDYLQELGINAIYLNPVFDSPSLHKYDAVSYHHIDPNFGPDPAGDRKLIARENPGDPSTWVWTSADRLALRLIREIHRRGMRVIFDGVFNHLGYNSWPFADVRKRQQQSPYADWFTIKSWDDPAKGTKFDFEGWFGFKTLPELREDAHGLVEGPRKYVFAATRRWMDPDGDGNPADGIDGWRLDVAFCIAHPFWKAWRKEVKRLNPEAYLTAEVIEPIPQLQPYLQGDEFDAVMNYNFAFACADYFVAEKKRVKTSELDRLLRELRQAFAPGVAYVQQNLFSSHDTNRLGSHIVNRDGVPFRDWGNYFGTSQASNRAYDTRKPTAAEVQVQKLFAIFQMTYVGAPMIYYGDEVGMWGANDPCSRKPMLWDDLRYADEAYRYDGTRRAKPDTVAVNRELLAHYRKLIGLRRSHPALNLGSFETLAAIDETQIYAFRRQHGAERIVVVLNNSNSPQELRLPLQTGAWRDALNDTPFEADLHGLRLSVPPQWGRILVRGER